MNDREEQMGEVIVTMNSKNKFKALPLLPWGYSKIPGANAGIENILKTLPGVNSNNELSTQYVCTVEIMMRMVCKWDRNLPSWSRQQEGLSFTNTDLVQNVEFSAGGFKQNLETNYLVGYYLETWHNLN
jgi:hypothetical protein